MKSVDKSELQGGKDCMNETFKGKGFGIKEWTITDEYLIFKGENIPYKNLDYFNLVTTPTTSLTNGIVNASYHGKVLTLAFAYNQKEKAHEVVEFVQEKINRAHGIEKDYKYLLTSKTGSKLEVYDDYVILYFMPVGSLIANIARGGNTGGKRINIEDITSLQFKEPSGVSVGFIQFSYPGSVDRKDGVVGAINDENSIVVDNNNLTKAKEVVMYLEKRRSNLQKGNQVVGISSADEIVKFKKLLDDGIISQEEFDAKKKQLLGL